MKKYVIICITAIILLLFYGYINKNNISSKKDDIPKIIDIIIGDTYYIALCDDRSVWSWGKYKNGKLGLGEITETNIPIKINELDNILKILDVGSCIYALSENGFVYGWGENFRNILSVEADEDKIFSTPIKLNGLENIKDLDAKNNKAFALDSDGKFYIWGIELYKDELNNMIPSFPEKHKDLIKDIEYITVGGGNSNYIKNSNGTIISIIEHEDDGQFKSYTFPYNNEDEGLYKDYTILSEFAKFSYTLSYQLKGMSDVEKISSDGYTMFIYKKDGSLLYWDSDRIKFHDDIRALRRDEKDEKNYSGYFKEVDIKEVLGINDYTVEIPRIVNMKASRENVMFLTDKGDVFVSFYKTYSIEDVLYYIDNYIESEGLFLKVIKDMNLKNIDFKKLDMNSITSINVDGNLDEFKARISDAYLKSYRANFSAVDSDGNYYHWNPNTFHIKHYKNN